MHSSQVKVRQQGADIPERKWRELELDALQVKKAQHLSTGHLSCDCSVPNRTSHVNFIINFDILLSLKVELKSVG